MKKLTLTDYLENKIDPWVHPDKYASEIKKQVNEVKALEAAGNHKDALRLKIKAGKMEIERLKTTGDDIGVKQSIEKIRRKIKEYESKLDPEGFKEKQKKQEQYNKDRINKKHKERLSESKIKDQTNKEAFNKLSDEEKLKVYLAKALHRANGVTNISSSGRMRELAAQIKHTVHNITEDIVKSKNINLTKTKIINSYKQSNPAVKGFDKAIAKTLIPGINKIIKEYLKKNNITDSFVIKTVYSMFYVDK